MDETDHSDVVLVWLLVMRENTFVSTLYIVSTSVKTLLS